jgi:hypothetical protein
VFQVCSKCKIEKYCCKPCQRQAWTEHKKTCGDITRLLEPCKCFDAVDMEVFKRQDPTVCSNPRCGNAVAAPFEHFGYAVQCLDQAKPMHLMTATYCSKDCHPKIEK